MNEIEQTNRRIHIINNPLSLTTRHRRSQRQRISPGPEPQPISTIDQLSSVTPALNKSNQILSPITTDTSRMTNTPNIIDQDKAQLPDNINNTTEDHDVNSTSPSQKKNSSTSDVNPFDRKKQTALAKAEGKLEKAQRLFQSAQQSIEQNISEFLRVTTIPGVLNESKTTNTAYEKRIRTLQETKKELEKKISNYQSDITRIQAGDIPHHYTSTKDILNNIKNKLSNENSKHSSTNDISTSASHEQSTFSHYTESDNHHAQLNLPSTSLNHNIGTANNNQNLLPYNQNSNTIDAIRSSPSNSISYEVGNSQFHIDPNFDHIYDGDKLNRKHDIIIPADISAIHEIDKSPSTRRRLTDDSNIEYNDRISDHSSDERFVSYNTSKRSTMTTIEYHQLMMKIDFMQKTIDRYETRMTDMQKQIDSLVSINESQHEQNERLNNELTDLTDLHQIEMLSMKSDLRKLEEKLLYNFNEYWTEMVEKFDKLDTRTTKVEQTLIHSHETEENTHRLISKLVNILLTVFAIILLLLSTIKNLVQSRVHAVILLILVFTWITIHYLPENYFQSPFLQNFTNIFKRSL